MALRVSRRLAIDTFWAAALGSAVLPIADRVLGQRMMRRYGHLQRAQWWSTDHIAAARDAAIHRLVTAALETQVYQELYRDAGADPGSVRTAEDLRRLPIVSKADLRAGFPERTTRPTGQPTYDECSAGSTGEPLCVKEDAATAGWYRASFLQILSWAGWRLGQPHVLLGMNTARPRGRALKDRLLRCRYVPSFDLTPVGLDRTLDHLLQGGIRFLFGYPVAVFELAKRAADRDLEMHLDGIVTWGDNLDAAFRTSIESAFAVKVLDAYGCAEGMWIASQCGASDLYHVHALDVVLELLDDDDQPVRPGTPGHVVVTRLHPGPSPLVRYRTGDLAIGATEACHCGRGYPTIAEVVGRSADMITTPTGNRLIVHFFTAVLEHFREVESFQVAKVGHGEAEVRVCGEAVSGPVMERITAGLSAKAPDMAWRVLRTDALAVTAEGKRRFVVDESKGQAL